MNNLVVVFGQKSKTIPIGVDDHYLKGALPARLRGNPPTANQLEDAILEAMPDSR